MSFTSLRMSRKSAVLRSCAGRSRLRVVLTLAFTLLGLSLVSGTAGSQVPHDMTYQGQLTDSVGAPLSGPVDLELLVFDLLSGGSALYAEDHTGVSLDDEGGFSVQLGAGSASTGSFDPSLFAGVNRYLEVVVDGEVLTPRQVLASVPWALVAEDVLFDPTNNIGTAITDAQNTADSALSDAATAAAGHTVDTTLNEAQVDAFVANNGYSAGAHTTDTNTQLTNSQVGTAAVAEGFVTGAHATDTKLNESQVDAFVANNGYSTGAHTTDTNTQLTNSQVGNAAIAEGFVTGAHATDTKLNEAQVDAFVANNGYSAGAHTTDTNTQLTNSQVGNAAIAEGFVTGAHTTNTTLNEAQVDAFVANNGYSAGAHTTDTNTQLTNSQVRNAAIAEGFVTGSHTTNTTLNESQVDVFVANNGFASATAASANSAAIAELSAGIASGDITCTSCSSFFAYLGADFMISSTFPAGIPFDETDHNVGNDFDSSIGNFTAPATGIYHFSSSIRFSNWTGAGHHWAALYFYVNGVNEGVLDRVSGNTGTGAFILSGSVTRRLNVTDVVSIRVQQTSGNRFVSGTGSGTFSIFSGFRAH